jgi:hypothetical protein
MYELKVYDNIEILSDIRQKTFDYFLKYSYYIEEYKIWW